MKKFISLILVITFIFNSGGHYLWFLYLQNANQKDIKREIRKGLKDNELTLIVVPLNDESALQWEKPQKEFKYQGEMFDVVRSKIILQKKYYYCINDKKEKLLIANFNKNNNKRGDIQKRLKRTSITNFFSPIQNKLCCLKSTDRIFIGKISFYKSNNPKIPSPPPKQNLTYSFT
ncbi:MAG: hypothetical protein CVU05_09960 [Bacteroidetes bacterium HGW-Bacteroidetes-21]|nr:MAG: hypothetical protein CVU05_09960 [Bacteroidetes bacterium HGW-Bacteroidetes-21]